MITIRDYAKLQGVSYEAIRKQVKVYEKDLKNHIIKQGRTQYLDDTAVEFLDKIRIQNPIVETNLERDAYIKGLENENKALLLKVAELQEQLLVEKDTVKALQGEKIALLEQKQKKHWWWRKNEN